MSTAIHRWVDACRAGNNPRTIGRIRSGWAVMGQAQFVRGYSLVLPDPVAADLNALDAASRRVLLEDVTVLGDALLAATNAVRINYEILGNLEPALHVHLFPRYSGEPADLRTKPVWFYDWDNGPQFDPARDAELVGMLRAHLASTGVLTGKETTR